MVRNPAVIGIDRSQQGFFYSDTAGKHLDDGKLTAEAANASRVLAAFPRRKEKPKRMNAIRKRVGE